MPRGGSSPPSMRSQPWEGEQTFRDSVTVPSTEPAWQGLTQTGRSAGADEAQLAERAQGVSEGVCTRGRQELGRRGRAQRHREAEGLQGRPARCLRPRDPLGGLGCERRGPRGQGRTGAQTRPCGGRFHQNLFSWKTVVKASVISTLKFLSREAWDLVCA